jgi:hypothetical protein
MEIGIQSTLQASDITHAKTIKSNHSVYPDPRWIKRQL